jgi:hypothetical protein
MLYRLRGQEAFRCRACRHRFYAAKSAVAHRMHGHRSPKPGALHPAIPNRMRLLRRLVMLAIFVLAFLIFWVFLRYITTERNPSEETPAGSLRVHTSDFCA